MKKALSHFDAIIIGSGSIGVPTALSLAKSGLKVLVLDSCPSVGQGSNKRAIGGIRATHSDPAKIRLCLRSIEIFSTWQEVYGEDIEWVQGGYCFVAYTGREEKILKELLQTQKRLGLDIDWLDRQTLHDIAPALNADSLLGGTYSPGDGNASPLLALHAFYAKAIACGAKFHYDEPVTGVIVKSGKICGVTTARDEYGTDLVINAAGAWARQVGKLVGLDLPVTPDCHEAGITESVAPLVNPMIVDIRPRPGSTNFYFYQHKTGQIIFCITPSPNIWGYDTNETSVFLPQVAKRMIEVMPRLQNIRIRRTWRGLYPMTPDGSPIVGWSREIEGLLQAVGTCGQGFMLGPGLGELLARMVTGNLRDDDQEILKILDPYRQFGKMEALK